MRWDVHSIKGGWLNQLFFQENMHLLRVSVSLILAALSTRCAASELDAFAYTCIDSYLNNPVLFSKCQRIDGSLTSTYIDLNNCLENKNGILYCASKRPKWVVIILHVDLMMTWHHHYCKPAKCIQTLAQISVSLEPSWAPPAKILTRLSALRPLTWVSYWNDWDGKDKWNIMNRFLFK